MTNPSITVVMPVYNNEQFVAEAIQSILGQTFTCFEFIIIDSCSTDNSLDIIKSFADERIIILESNINQGNYIARNKAHRVSRGKYICVMDPDDISFPDRLEKQYAFMEQNPDVGLAGSCIKYVGSEQTIFKESDYELNKIKLLKNNYICHSSMIMRHEWLKKYNLVYDENFLYAGDYYFIVCASDIFKVVNMPDVLLNCRWSQQQLSTYVNERIIEINEVVLTQLSYFDVTPTQEEMQIHLQLVNCRPLDVKYERETLKWIQKLSNANKRKGKYSLEYLEDFFEILLKRQIWFKNEELLDLKTAIFKENRINLTDVTFIIPIRIETGCCRRNIDTVLRFIDGVFLTNVIIIEADKHQRYILPKTTNTVSYSYLYNESSFLHVTRLHNQMLEMVQTPYAAVWDANVLVLPENIMAAVAHLRKNKVAMAFPYDGRILKVDSLFSKLFYSHIHKYEELIKLAPALNSIDGYHNACGAFFVNCKKFREAGGENENMLGSGLENEERLKRIEVLCQPAFRADGALFQLWNPIALRGNVADKDVEKRNLKILIETCKHQIQDRRIIDVSNVSIPKFIHQIWESPTGEPDNKAMLAFAETWKGKNPTWEYIFWDTASIHRFLDEYYPDFIETYKAYKYDVQRWDAIRYLILYKMGGLYVDFDYECLEPIGELLENKTCCFGLEHSQAFGQTYIINNAFVAAVPTHPFLMQVINEITNISSNAHDKVMYVLETTGSVMLNRLFKHYTNKYEVCLIPSEFTSPLLKPDLVRLAKGEKTSAIKQKLKKAYAIHHFWGAWNVN